MKDFSYITNSHPAFIEGLYEDFSKDPNSVDPEFCKFFEGFDFAIGNGKAANGASNGQATTTNGTTQVATGSAVTDWRK